MTLAPNEPTYTERDTDDDFEYIAVDCGEAHLVNPDLGMNPVACVAMIAFFQVCMIAGLWGAKIAAVALGVSA